MKKLLLTCVGIVCGAVSVNAATLLQYDFFGATNTSASNTATSTFEAAGLLDSTMTRGAAISANNAANSFRGTGFSNDGIALSNTDYFEFNLTASSGTTFSVESIYGNFAGTSSFSSTPGVTMAYAYSLDGGTTFTLMSTFSRVGSGTATYTVAGADLIALSNINSVVFRFYASGQSTTGGWGYQSNAAEGTIGMQVDGTITPVPEPSTYALLFGGAGVLFWVVRRKRQTA